MFSKFNVTLSNEIYAKSKYDKDYYKCIGKSMYKQFGDIAKNNLKEYINGNGVIDASSLQEEWFNQIDANIFLSHSHKDIDDVIAFAGWLKEEFKLIAFIDSCVWGYCDDLLNQIDKAYCKNDGESTYNYTMRNYSTSHVHMMLSVALAKMIDSTECVMFLNTPNSIDWKEELLKIKENNSYKTFSPWIYDELAMTSMIKVEQPIRYEMEKKGTAIFEHAEFKMQYDVTEYIEQMIELSPEDLNYWRENSINVYGGKALDGLYLTKNLIKENFDSIF